MNHSQSPRIALEARNLFKRYGHVMALSGADLQVGCGEILAVIGDNGAGKSTLIRCLTGATRPDSGEVFVDGRAVSFASPADARKAGIECCYQDLALFPSMSIAENFFLGRELRSSSGIGRIFRRLDRRRMTDIAANYLSSLEVHIPSMSAAVETLSGGQRQCIAVARAAAFASHAVILDEPTAALGVRESGMVVELIRRIRDRGLAVVLISHDMPKVYALADRIHVARLGKRAALLDPRTTDMSTAVSVMTGALSP